MNWSLVRVALAAPIIALALTVPMSAQEGHPMKGSWIGVWEGNTALGNDVLMVMNWDGKNITGIINPGTDNIKIGTATLDPNGWKVHIEADAKNKTGGPLHLVIDGTIKTVELPSRSIVGTWTGGAAKGKFEIHRQ